MPKYRKLHVASIHSLDIADMPDDFHRLMWTWLPLISCAKGRGLDIGAWLQGQIFPLRPDVTGRMCDEAMTWFAERGMVERYIVNGRHYYQIINWHKYQGDTTRESDSIWPEPAHEQVKQAEQPRVLPTLDELTSNSRVSHEQVTSSSCTDAYSYADTDTKAEGNARATQTLPPAKPKPRQADADFPPPPQKPSIFKDAPIAATLIHEFTGYWPGAVNGPLLQDRLGDNPDRAVLKQAVRLWQAAGLPVDNLMGLCDWYDNILRDPDWRPSDRLIKGKLEPDCDEMVTALSVVTGMDARLNFEKLKPTALELVTAGYAPDQVRGYYARGAPPGQRNWYSDDWRGRKGDMPTPRNISETIGGAVKTTQAAQPEGGKLWLEFVKDFRS